MKRVLSLPKDRSKREVTVFVYKTQHLLKQKIHHEIKIPERDVTYIVLSVYLLILIHR